jgi:hypothetical protein
MTADSMTTSETPVWSNLKKRCPLIGVCDECLARPSELTLSFGRDSRLAEFEAGSRGRLSDRSFLQFSSGSLKIFRTKLEFADE